MTGYQILRLAAAIAGCLIAGGAKAQGLWRIDRPLQEMTIQAPSDIAARRQQLSQFIWGSDTPQPPSTVTRVSPGNSENGQQAPGYLGRTPETSVWLNFDLGRKLWARVYYATFPGAKCLVVVNAGHEEGFFPPSGFFAKRVNSKPGVDALVRQIAAKPCDLILNSMPLQGENRLANRDSGIDLDMPDIHRELGKNLTPATGSSLRYFLDPALGAIDHALRTRDYELVAAVGLSGGGWETTVLAALDPRIKRSYSVAGSVPVVFREEDADWEQHEVPLDYLDLYAMGVGESGRKNFQFYNEFDPCCFKQTSVMPWAAPLSQRLATFPGEFGVYIIAMANTHDIQPEVAKFILNDLSK